MKKEKEVFISVDLETDGSIPYRHSLLSIGACAIDDQEKKFYCELKPISDTFEPEAMAVNGLDHERLKTEGLDPKEAMTLFGKWVNTVAGGAIPVFVGFSAPFDWMFSHWYFIYFLGNDPFGYSALDIQAYFMGMSGEKLWARTSKAYFPKAFLPGGRFTHNALEDAIYQAEMFRRMREHNGRKLNFSTKQS